MIITPSPGFLNIFDITDRYENIRLFADHLNNGTRNYKRKTKAEKNVFNSGEKKIAHLHVRVIHISHSGIFKNE